VRFHRSLSKLALLAAVTPCLLSAPAGAASIAYEGFDYASGAFLNGENGGSGWAGAWAAGNPLTFIAVPGLAFGSLGATGGAATATVKPDPPQGGDITFEQRQLAASFGADNTALYLSFLLRPETGFGFYGGFNLGGLFIGKSGQVNSYSLETTGNIVSSSIAPQVGETVLLVLRAQFQAGNDLFDLFVNPVPGVAEPALADATMTNVDLLADSFVTINNAGAWTLDEIRIGSTLADVTPSAVPEPPVALLLATGLLLVGLSARSCSVRL
jgi:hypothetical protein